MKDWDLVLVKDLALKSLFVREIMQHYPLKTVIPEKDFDGNPGKAGRQEAQGKCEQIHEGEMYARSMSCGNVPSGRQMI